MEYLDGYVPLAECAEGAQATALERLFDRFTDCLYGHRSRNPGAAEDWLLRHLETKIAPKIVALRNHPVLGPLAAGEGIEIDGAFCPSLERLLAHIREPNVLSRFVPAFLSPVHGDLTFQNIMVGPGGDVKAIDMEAQEALEAVELDLGKIFQSTHSGYEHWSHLSSPLCHREGGAIRLGHRPVPKHGPADVVRRRWAAILGCSADAVEMRGAFYLGLHLVRMVPFRLKKSADQAAYALCSALMRLHGAVEQTRSGAPRLRRAAA